MSKFYSHYCPACQMIYYNDRPEKRDCVRCGNTDVKFSTERIQAMNQAQKKYAMDRVNAIASQKVKALQDKYTIPAKKLTVGEALKLIKAGKVKTKADATKDEMLRYVNIGAIWDFSKYETKESIDPKFQTESAVIFNEASRIRDQIMLGDADEALKLIQAFEK